MIDENLINITFGSNSTKMSTKDILMFQIYNLLIEQLVVLIQLNDHNDYQFDLIQHINYSFLERKI